MGADRIGSAHAKGGGRVGAGRKVNDADLVALAKILSTKANRRKEKAIHR